MEANKYAQWTIESFKSLVDYYTTHLSISSRLYVHIMGFWDWFLIVLVLVQITSASSMLSFKGSPYWMAPEVWSSPYLLDACSLFYVGGIFSSASSCCHRYVMFCMIPGCYEYMWLQSCSGYMELGMYNSWNGYIKTTLESVWRGMKLDVLSKSFIIPLALE